MARKSRKNKAVPQTQIAVSIEPAQPDSVQQQVSGETTVKIPAAAYVRLSVENSNRGNEDTIQTQIELVHDYIYDHPELTLYDTYADNGFTGTNFHRPEFERMMDDVRRGRVQCIVVKDLSRFGRDYLEAGYYVETIFPRLGVRLIAVTDNFDSSRREDVEGLEFPVRNLVNSLYAKDISRKVVSYYEEINKRGGRVSSRPPYGYLSEKGDNGFQLFPDPETEGYVRVIFHWFLSGVNPYEIARRLNLVGAETPNSRILRLYKGERMPKSIGKGLSWTAARVNEILNNQAYAGDTVNGMSQTAKYKGIEWHATDRDSWNIIPDTHTPLISREDWERACEIKAEAKREKEESCSKRSTRRIEHPALFKGKIYCGECGHLMSPDYRERRGDGSPYNVYRCTSNKRGSRCTGSSVNEELLKLLVMDQIRLLVHVGCDKRRIVKELVSENPWKGKLGAVMRKAVVVRNEIEQIEDKEMKAYGDYSDGLLDKEDYVALKESLRSCRQTKETELQQLRREEKILRETADKYLKLTDGFDEYVKLEGYRPELVERLIDRIDYYPDGSIGIQLKCADIYAQMESLIKEE